MGDIYHVIIIGGGPAGLSAGLYASRAKLQTLLIERAIIGGQITNSAHVENYPGFPDGISGFELTELMHKQATNFGMQTTFAEVQAIDIDQPNKVIKTTEGRYTARAVIIAGGASLSRLGVPGEERLTGKGISYCATCDGPFFKEKIVAVVGGGVTALDAAAMTRPRRPF